MNDVGTQIVIDICLDSKCKHLDNERCDAYNEEGRNLRRRLRYCPIIDWPKKEVKTDRVRVGQQHQKIKKKK